MKVSFIEDKRPDLARVGRFLESSASRNHWANGGPLWHLLQEEMAAHMGLPPDVCLIPCANAGIALEAMARLWAMRFGRRLRWLAPAFAFRNLGRGYFADVQFLDCDANAMLDMAAVEAANPDSYDGLIAVNPMGHAPGFEAVIAFAKARNLPLLLDNAAGIGTRMPDWGWQALSLHHTKPYGMGEGGLILLPRDQAAVLEPLITYGDRAPEPPEAWLNNGKISDISCAFLLDRLRDAPNWIAASTGQRQRIGALAAEFGLRPLCDGGVPHVALTSVAFFAETPVPEDLPGRLQHFMAGKYYRPLADLPQAADIFRRIISVPSHGGMAALSDDQIRSDLAVIAGGGRVAPASWALAGTAAAS
jgi:dTDP-4-amino-4,6-dideoxygalactose transaminase